MGVLAFFCVSFGGIVIGVFFGLLSTYVTKYTMHVRGQPSFLSFNTKKSDFLCMANVEMRCRLIATFSDISFDHPSLKSEAIAHC